MFQLSENANKNYVCKIVKLQGLHKHSNADRLQVVSIDFNNVITGLDAKDGDIYCYFPVECKISKEFLSKTNSFRDSKLNADSSKTGFFEENCRVRAMRLRGEKSMGYIVPISALETFIGKQINNIEDYVNVEFDTINNLKFVEKYFVPIKNNKQKNGKEPAVTRLVDGQVHLHVDTENLRRNAHKINPTDLITISYKTHGTSGWVSNVLVKKQLGWLERLAVKLRFNIVDKEYDIVYGSRRVVKNKHFDDPNRHNHFFDYDLWKDVIDQNNLSEVLPKGYTMYYEILGYTKDGKEIQKNYHYGCAKGEHKIEVYRITFTNEDGLVSELSTPQIQQFCNSRGLNTSHVFYHGLAKDLYPELSKDHWNENFVKQLEKDFNEKDCFMCTDVVVPEEGICIRNERVDSYDVYKLKSFRFLEAESKELDLGVVSLEETN